MPQHARPVALAVVLVVVLSSVAGLAAAGLAAAGPSAPVGAAVGTADLQNWDWYDEANATEETTITVSATGQVEADPDRAVVLVASTAVADDPANATARLAANVSTLRAALLAANLSADQFRTTDYNVFEQRPDDRPVEVGGDRAVRYVAQQGFEVTLDDVNRTGEIVDLAVTNGATSVRDVSFTLSEETRQALRADALGEAMADAGRQAAAIAAAENLTIDRVASVTSGDGGFVPVRAQAFEEAAPTGGTQIDSGPVTVTATVRVTYVAADRGS